jgi:hypothetical protein
MVCQLETRFLNVYRVWHDTRDNSVIRLGDTESNVRQQYLNEHPEIVCSQVSVVLQAVGEPQACDNCNCGDQISCCDDAACDCSE